MDHEATRELLELAAVEPGGLERLMAGDTPAAQAVAAHLAGCRACADELARLERAARVIGQVVRELPPADLRERTLATVRAAGIPRGAAVGVGVAAMPTERSAAGTAVMPPAAAAAGAPTLSSPSVPASAVPAPRHSAAGLGGGGRRALGWVATVAAAVVVSVVATSLIVGGRVDEQLSAQTREIEALERVTVATLEVTAESDARRVALSGTEASVAGTIVYSPSTSELVVVATGLTPPPANQEYRCWVEQAGDRQGVGKMFFSDDLAYWIGPVDAVAGLVGDARFGVTLVSLDGSTEAQDVLEGGL